MLAIYESLYTGLVKVEIIGKYKERSLYKIRCKVISKDNRVFREGGYIDTTLLFLWLKAEHTGIASTRYEGKPDLEAIPEITALHVSN